MTLEALMRQTFSLPSETPIADSHGPGDLAGWDSLGHVTLMAALESTYQITIGIDEVMTIERVADIKRLLKAKGVNGF